MPALDTPRGSFNIALDGDTAAPALILSNSLGATLETWAPQVAPLSKHYRLIRYDTRGHGGSLVTAGPYRLEDLGQDVLAILDALQIERATFCGLSLGGHTGLWLGIHASTRLRALVVCNSAAKLGTPESWHERATMVRRDRARGMQALADSAPQRWFSEAFVAAHPDTVRRTQALITSIDPDGYAACCDALANSDLRADIKRIPVPTLLIAGALDPVTSVADAQAMQAQIAGARLTVLPASHLSNLEAPDAFNQALLDFLSRLG